MPAAGVPGGSVWLLMAAASRRGVEASDASACAGGMSTATPWAPERVQSVHTLSMVSCDRLAASSHVSPYAYGTAEKLAGSPVKVVRMACRSTWEVPQPSGRGAAAAAVSTVTTSS